MSIVDIDPFIYRELNNNSSLTNIIGTRLEKYFGEIDIQKPYVTYSIVPGSDEYRTKTKTNVISYMITMIADDLPIAQSIKQIIFDLLNDFGGRMGDYSGEPYVTVIQASLVNERTEHNEVARIYKYFNDYKFIYRR